MYQLLRTIVEPLSQLFMERRDPFRVRGQELASSNLSAVFDFRQLIGVRNN
jgi:hypothetical protein